MKRDIINKIGTVLFIIIIIILFLSFQPGFVFTTPSKGKWITFFKPDQVNLYASFVHTGIFGTAVIVLYLSYIIIINPLLDTLKFK